MSDKPFHFKQFSIRQDQTAMKVGTDGVLLGAWVAIKDATDSILDIGTGTGLIALQLAQRSDATVIDALEIENRAFEQAVENFESSPWGDRLFCYHASLNEFTREIDETYDLIVSNPPFFKEEATTSNKERTLARQMIELSYEELLSSASKLISESGSCAFIIPYTEESDFLSTAIGLGLHPERVTRVRGHHKSPVKRSLVQLNRRQLKTVFEELVIERKRHEYTKAYTDLVKDFYLRL
jgi:tRNA1Val (adenine37-N6)-methyltransferase